MEGGGAVFTDLTYETDMVSTGRRWTTEETCHHINVLELRRFALAFIHSHSGATGVFRNAFMRKVAEATSCLPKTLQTT